MDIADQAQIEMETEEQMRARIDTRPEAPVTGVCLNCQEPLPHNWRWCDTLCQNDWQHRENRKKAR